MSNNLGLADIFRRARQAGKAPKPKTKTQSRLIKPDCSPYANYHTVNEYTVSVASVQGLQGQHGKDAMSWVCNNPGCEVQLNSASEAEDHVASTCGYTGHQQAPLNEKKQQTRRNMC